MGFLNKFFGGPEGVREAISDSYHKHLRLARGKPGISEQAAHAAALYGALGSRYTVLGKSFSEPALWAELAPFMAISSWKAIVLLGDYVVFQEMPHAADTEVIAKEINSALQVDADDQQKQLAAVAYLNGVAWAPLLRPATVTQLKAAAAKITEG